MVFRLLLITLLALGSFTVVAHDAKALSLNPPIFEFVMSPGERLEDAIKVFNDTKETVMLKPEKVNFTAKSDDEISGAPEFYSLDETRTGRELAPWIEVVDTEMPVDPLTRQDIPFAITAPEDASPGSYFGGIILRSGEASERGVGLVTGTAVLMLVKVDGDVIEDAALTDFDVGGALLTHLPAEFHARIVNQGTVHLQPTGEVEIRDMFGKLVGFIPMNAGLHSVLPESARRYAAVWGREPEEGTSEFTKEWNGFAFGKYTATLTLAYGKDAKPLRARTSFWVVPWMVLVSFAAGLLILVFGTWAFFRWYARHLIAKRYSEEN